MGQVCLDRPWADGKHGGSQKDRGTYRLATTTSRGVTRSMTKSTMRPVMLAPSTTSVRLTWPLHGGLTASAATR